MITWHTHRRTQPIIVKDYNAIEWLLLSGQTVVATSQIFILGIPAQLAATWFPPDQTSTATSIGVFGNQVREMYRKEKQSSFAFSSGLLLGLCCRLCWWRIRMWRPTTIWLDTTSSSCSLEWRSLQLSSSSQLFSVSSQFQFKFISLLACRKLFFVK